MNYISNKQFLILQSLSKTDRMFGLDLVRKNKALKRGLIYVDLLELENRGLVHWDYHYPKNGKPRRSVFSISEFGRTFLKELDDELSDQCNRCGEPWMPLNSKGICQNCQAEVDPTTSAGLLSFIIVGYVVVLGIAKLIQAIW